VSRLRGITAFGQNDVWAVGDSGNATLAVHWDGATWSIVPTPDPDPKVNVLHAVAGVAGNDVWAVGRMAQNEADTGVPPGTRTLAMHWDGTTWQTVSTPNVDDQNSLTGIAATSPASVTAVGAFEDRSGDGAVLRTLGQRWNGSSWDTLGTPDVGTADNLLRSAAPIPGTADVWAVGEYRAAGGPVQTLVMRDSSATAPGVQSPPEQAPAASSEPTSMGEPPSANEPTAASQPTATSEQAPTGAAAAPGETCGPVRVTLALGKPGLRARRISVNAGGKKQLLRGPRKRVTVTVAYTRARQALLTVRIRGRAGELRMIRRTVSLCR
jgi:hypothetical protein